MRVSCKNRNLIQDEIKEKTLKIIHNCVPELDGVEITESSVVNTDMGMDSMNFILVICKIEAEFDIKIPNRQWNRLRTFGQLVDAIEKYSKK